MKQLTFILLLVLATSTFSQSNIQEKPFIEVIGTSIKEIIPDEFFLDIFLKERMEKGKKLSLEVLEKSTKKRITKNRNFCKKLIYF